ncbi:PspA/IM30 family protein [Bacillus lacus]|uniref:PspA/IM30 family protein n=1 Tax=Metabacillus lacus TaxID=1983721 RepID=A0A7X2LYR5_9BACI|nr:PspA/IM30 family protein [Metabacillus lacus]MRX71182.1 PspA/IM30 family protein [Metabacillus lacus]
MMNFFQRLTDTITADLNELLDEKDQKSPISMLNKYLRDSEYETEKVRKLIERQHILKDEFSKEYQEAAAMAEKRKQQAEVASRAGELELYDFVVHERSIYENRAKRIQSSMEEAAQQLRNLESKYEEMNHKLKDMYLKRMELMGKENMARAQYNLNKLEKADSAASEAKSEQMGSCLDKQEPKNWKHQSVDARIEELKKELEQKESNSLS